MNIEKLSKIILAILLFLCLAPMSYGYFQLVRLVAIIAFAYYAYIELKAKNTALVLTFILLFVLFQPFEKIALGRTLWNIVDAIVGIGLLVYAGGSKAKS